ncbi:hypothetical protein C942_00478 [Photobacterium marinum]|uniref:Apea-like HEPN domain-containing protein n=1 Tax=Photobacterium marinum TaxID=1056511 RepID=L8JB48_9GAMM|nr:hypothetical protein [Photobacterium marinum]ELR66036.1 hypothetical protein C942_00478 [Photobacterium marinum]
MSSRWRDEKQVKSLIKQMKKMLKICDDGNVAQKPYFELVVDTLWGYVKHNKKLDNNSSFDVFHKSVVTAYKNNGLNDIKTILSEFDKAVLNLSKNESEFKILMSLEMDCDQPSSRVVNGCKLSFYKSPPKKYAKAVLVNEDIASYFEKGNFLYSVVSVSAPNRNSALEKADSAIDTVRAIWHMLFIKNFNLVGEDKESQYWSRSLTRLGKYHIIYDKNGKMLDNGLLEIKNHISYQSSSVRDISIFNRNTNVYLRKIAKSPYKEFIENVLSNYVSAVDCVDLDYRFMRLSSTLEILLKADQTKDLVRKATFLYEDKELENIILTNLRNSRNELSHVGVTPPNIEIKCFKLAQYIEDLLNFFIFNPIKADRVQQIHDLLSSPTDLTVIESKIKQLEMAREYMKD